VICVYDTPALIKGDWIFNQYGMGHRENLYGDKQEMLNVKPCFPFLEGLNKPFPTNNRRPDHFISFYLASLTRFS
jgi:hypothetical protein